MVIWANILAYVDVALHESCVPVMIHTKISISSEGMVDQTGLKPAFKIKKKL